jgi:hypothetical protein
MWAVLIRGSDRQWQIVANCKTKRKAISIMQGIYKDTHENLKKIEEY